VEPPRRKSASRLSTDVNIDPPRHLQYLGHMIHHCQTRPSILPLTQIEDRDDGRFSVLLRVAGDDGVYFFTVFFVELEFDLYREGRGNERCQWDGYVVTIGDEIERTG
jgi:hypothetical protein